MRSRLSSSSSTTLSSLLLSSLLLFLSSVPASSSSPAALKPIAITSTTVPASSSSLAHQAAAVAEVICPGVPFAPSSPSASPPLVGLAAALSQRGAELVVEQAYGAYREGLRPAVLRLHVSDQKGSQSSIDYKVKHIEVEVALPPAENVRVILDDSGILLGFKNVKATVKCDWSAKESIWPHPSAHGSAKIKLKFDLAALFLPSVKNGRPIVGVRKAKVDIDDFDMDFHGSDLDWVLNKIKDFFKHDIKNAIEDAMAAGLSSQGQASINAALQSLPIAAPIPYTNLFFDYRLVMQEVMGKGLISLPLNGTVYATQGAPYTGRAGPLPTHSDTTKYSHAQAFLSDYVLNSAFYSLTQAGYLNYTINPEDIPSASPIQLNTSSWQFVIPKLYSMYPNWGMKATLSPYPSAPTTTITSTGIIVNATTLLSMWVVSPTNGTAFPAFSLYINGSLVGKASLQSNFTGTFVNGSIAKLNFGIGLFKSSVGEFDLSLLDTLFSMAINTLGVPFLNSLLERGVMAIPYTPGSVNLVGSSLSYANSYLSLSANITYQSSSLEHSWPLLDEQGANTIVVTEEDIQRQIACFSTDTSLTRLIFGDDEQENDALMPGLMSVISQSGLDYMSSVGLKFLIKKLPSVVINVPDAHGSKDSIDWSVSSIYVKNLNMKNLNLSLKEHQGYLTFQTSGVSASVSAHWHGREHIWPHPSASGSASISLSADITVVMKLGEIGGRPNVLSSETSAHITSFGIHFSGSHLDWMLNLLKHVFEGSIKSAIQHGIENGINDQGIAAINKVIDSIPTSYNIRHTDIALNYSLTGPALLGYNFMTLPMVGRFDNVKTGQIYPKQPTTLPVDDTKTPYSHIQFFVGEYFFNSGSYIFQQAGYMNLTIHADDVPKESPVQFNTSSWKYLVPALYDKYPNYEMKAKLGAYPGPPKVSISPPTGATVEGSGLLNMFVISPKDGTSIPVFTLLLNFNATGHPKVHDNVLHGNIVLVNTSLSLVKSEIGDFNADILSGIYGFAASIIVKALNAHLEQGVVLPSIEGVTIKSSQVYYNLFGIGIAANITWDIPFAIAEEQSVDMVAPLSAASLLALN